MANNFSHPLIKELINGLIFGLKLRFDLQIRVILITEIFQSNILDCRIGSGKVFESILTFTPTNQGID